MSAETELTLLGLAFIGGAFLLILAPFIWSMFDSVRKRRK